MDKFQVKCTESRTEPFKVGVMYNARGTGDGNETQFVMTTPLEHFGIKYDNGLFKYDGYLWKFERV